MHLTEQAIPHRRFFGLFASWKKWVLQVLACEAPLSRRRCTERIGADRCRQVPIGIDRLGSARIGIDRLGSDRIKPARIGSDRG